jgi:hypothetical protein
VRAWEDPAGASRSESSTVLADKGRAQGKRRDRTGGGLWLWKMDR